MADNVEVTPGTGTPIATDDVGGVQYQRVKLDAGDNGVTRPLIDRGTIPLDTDPALPVRQAPVDFWRCGFAGVGSGVVTPDLQLEQTGSGMAVSQSGGNLVITTGTTANAETVVRSIRSFRGALIARFKTILSQRIVNQTFRIELADLIGNALAFVINSATSVTVTFPAGTNPFTAANVGQSMRLSEIAGAAGIPGRYAIASVSGDTVTFTVAAWPASGSGTLTLYGRNYLQTEYSGTTATNAFVDGQRDGWNSGNTTATINTTASPGHVMQVSTDIMSAAWSDGLVASNAGVRWTERADRIENIPDDDQELYLFIVAQNGSTAPASTTTWTIGYVQVEMQGRNKVKVGSSDPGGAMQALPVAIRQAASLTIGTLPATPAGTNTIGQVRLAHDTGQGASTAHRTAFVANITTGAPTSVKASVGNLNSGRIANNCGAGVWFHLYNKASAPTLGTDTPEASFWIPAGGTMVLDCGPFGERFATGIAYAITDNCAAIPAVGGTITIASTAAAICVSLRYT